MAAEHTHVGDAVEDARRHRYVVARPHVVPRQRSARTMTYVCRQRGRGVIQDVAAFDNVMFGRVSYRNDLLAFSVRTRIVGN